MKAISSVVLLAILQLVFNLAKSQEILLHQDGDFQVLVDSKAITDGQKPQAGDKVAVHYTGTFEDGEEFDSSYKRDRPFVFEIGKGRVIKCWDQAFMHLSKGMKAKSQCPHEFAYGQAGAGRIIPPNSDLTFEVELVDINPVEKSPED